MVILVVELVTGWLLVGYWTNPLCKNSSSSSESVSPHNFLTCLESVGGLTVGFALNAIGGRGGAEIAVGTTMEKRERERCCCCLIEVVVTVVAVVFVVAATDAHEDKDDADMGGSCCGFCCFCCCCFGSSSSESTW